MQLSGSLCLLIACTTWAVATPQLVFPDDDKPKPAPNKPVGNNLDDEVQTTRIGILASYLSD